METQTAMARVLVKARYRFSFVVCSSEEAGPGGERVTKAHGEARAAQAESCNGSDGSGGEGGGAMHMGHVCVCVCVCVEGGGGLSALR